MNIATTRDIIQEAEGELAKPEIRVWCHPKNGGDDWYKVFSTFKEALTFIASSKEAERIPLIAFRGWEINLWSMAKASMIPRSV